MINKQKLVDELIEAGIPIGGINNRDVIQYKDEATEAHRTQAEAIKAAHDPYDAKEEQRKDYPDTLDLLDLLWDDIDNNKVSKAGGFYKKIKKAKDDHPNQNPNASFNKKIKL